MTPLDEIAAERSRLTSTPDNLEMVSLSVDACAKRVQADYAPSIHPGWVQHRLPDLRAALVRAAALIVAEIERLDLAAAKGQRS